MDADILNLEALFHQQVSYRIPQFQRPYAWNEEVQWKPLWEDIHNVAIRFLNANETGKIRSHFMGAIVLQQQRSNTGEVKKILVVDGQQRLTTLQLLLKATEQVFQSRNDSIRASQLRELTINQESHWGRDSDNETIIRQSNRNDQRAFQEAIRNSNSGDENSTWAISALNYFKEAVATWLDSSSENLTDRANALEKALTKHVELAVIDLDEEEKPHVIFETLNARGAPLRQSDLIKNTVMYEANVIDDDEQARKLWGVFDQNWWRHKIKDGKLNTIHIERFLRYWMIMRRLNDVTENRVALEFRNYLEEAKPSIHTVAVDIQKAGIHYALIEGCFRGHGITPERETFFKRLKTIELGVVTPVVLWLLTSDVPKERQQRCIDMLESYGVRRKLSGLATAGLNKVFIGLLQALDRDGPAAADTTVLRFLRAHQADGSVWPNNRMLCEYLASSPMKGSAAWKKMVLEAVELHLRSDRSEELGATSNLTVEHIMPQGWNSDNWPLSPGMVDHDEVEDIRNEAIQKIGNLTLTTEKLNKSLSNGPWHEKRRTLDNHSTLFLNKTLLDDAPDVWDEEAIEKRSQFLAGEITEIWPYADSFDESDS